MKTRKIDGAVCLRIFHIFDNSVLLCKYLMKKQKTNKILERLFLENGL